MLSIPIYLANKGRVSKSRRSSKNSPHRILCLLLSPKICRQKGYIEKCGDLQHLYDDATTRQAARLLLTPTTGEDYATTPVMTSRDYMTIKSDGHTKSFFDGVFDEYLDYCKGDK